MLEINYGYNSLALKDMSFLKSLDTYPMREYYILIELLDLKENSIRFIEGKISGGSISVDGSSSIRRSGSLTFVPTEDNEMDITDIESVISINRKIIVYIGLRNYVNPNYDDIIWFKQGVFVITQASTQHTLEGVSINIQIKDKMCLLNGECGGRLPASVIFDSQDVTITQSASVALSVDDILSPQENCVYHIIGGGDSYYMWDEDLGWYTVDPAIIGTVVSRPNTIYDIIKTCVAFYGHEDVCNIYIQDIEKHFQSIVRNGSGDPLYILNADNRATYTEPDPPMNSDGSSKIKSVHGFNEDCGYIYTKLVYPGSLVSNLNDSVCSILDKIISTLGNYEYFYDLDGNFIFREKKNYLNTQFVPSAIEDAIINNSNFKIAYNENYPYIYTFDTTEDNLIISIADNPNYDNIKNDYHIWGKNATTGYAIHYHLFIKDIDKSVRNTYHNVYFDEDDIPHIDNINTTGTVSYTPTDWRAEMYMSGLYKQSLGIRPDIYEQELLDLFDSIYNMKTQTWKQDINNTNTLTYWVDCITPDDTNFADICVDKIGSRIEVNQNDKINKIKNPVIPNLLFVDVSTPYSYNQQIIQSTDIPHSQIPHSVYSQLIAGTIGYSAEETMREMLYQHTDYNESVSISTIPIYYLEPNRRIVIKDKDISLNGEYIIQSFNIPLDGSSTMSITANKALERI